MNAIVLKWIRRMTFVVCLLFPLSSQAQYARLYTTQNGLKSSGLYAARFDSKGMAWVTGVGTLQLFDGTTFMDVLKDEKELKNAVFNNVMEFKDDEYWLITSKGLRLYNLRTNHMELMTLVKEDDENDNTMPIHRMIHYPKQDYALITTSGYGLYVFDMAQQKVDEELTQRLSNVVGMNMFRDVMVSYDDCLWVSGIEHELLCVNLKQMKQVPLKVTDEAQRILNKAVVSAFCELRKSHNVLIATTAGLLVYDRGQQIVRRLKGGSDPQFTVSCVKEMKDGRVMLGMDSHGLWQMDGDENTMPYTIPSHFIDLTYAKVRSIDEDDEGNMIVGIYQKGVLVVPNSQDNFIYMPISPTSAHANVACITAIASDHDGQYWVGTDGCGVLKSLDADLSDAKLVNSGLSSLQVQAINVDRDGTVWVGSFGGGVQCLQGEHFVTPDWLQQLASTLVMSMSYDPLHHLMYVGTNGGGVMMLNLTTHDITPLSKYGDFNAWTAAVYCDAVGMLWCGTVSETFWFNPSSLMLKRVDFGDNSNQSAQCFAADGMDVLIGTNEGLYRFRPQKGDAQLILSERNVLSIETTDSDIWLATSNGIVRIDKKTNSTHTYTSFGGYYIGDFHKHASYQSPAHMIYYGADNGVIGFNATNLKQQRKLNNSLILTSLKVNGYDRYYNEDAGSGNVLNQSLLYATKLAVPYDQNTLAFTFSVPNYSSPNRIFYRYILEGYDKNWHAASSNHEAYYSSLPSGSYTLMMQAYYENNENMVVEKAISIYVGYPWYATWWAWLIYLIVTGLIGYYLYNTYKVRARQRQLLSQVRHNEQIKEAKLRMFASISHEMKSPLTMIVSPLRQLMSEHDEGTASEKKLKSNEERRQSLYKVMNMNCERLLRIVKQVTDIRKIDNGQFQLHFSEVNFADYADEIFKTFSGYAVSKRISFVIEHANNNVSIWLDKIHFEKILSNLLSNAFKFTPEDGRVIVRTRSIRKESMDWFEIRVYNSGSSIDPKDMPHIFERFYQANTVENLNVGSGIGLNLATELVTLHHGTITVNNVDPDGVEFIMQFPLGRAHLSSEELVSRDFAEQDEPTQHELADMTGHEVDDVDEETDEKHIRTVLIVDDDERLCDYIRDILKEHYHIMVAYDGDSAWQQILTQRPDAVVTDIRMPVCDGIELCKRIRSNPDTDNLPIIILTSESSDKTRIYSLNLDVDHFINKPFNPLMLQGAVAHSMRVRERMMSRLRRTEVGFDYTTTTIDSPDDKMFGRVIQAIKTHIDDTTFGVNELAREVGVSRAHLNRKMKERYGMSPVNFIRSYRLKQSAYLLVNNQVSISDVAYRMGFSSHPYFSNVFREYFGMSPKEFIAYYADNANDEVLQKLLE